MEFLHSQDYRLFSVGSGEGGLTARTKRSIHQRLQEYCDCYVDVDPGEELERISFEGVPADATGDKEEAALKFLANAILYSIKECARAISLTKSDRGDIRLYAISTDTSILPPPPSDLADRVFDLLNSITHMETPNSSGLLALGVRGSSLELKVTFSRVNGKQIASLFFPEF
ncbi:hypothetical protein ACFL4G_01905 [Thermodesulfobacteriota bacterium]